MKKRRRCRRKAIKTPKKRSKKRRGNRKEADRYGNGKEQVRCKWGKGLSRRGEDGKEKLRGQG